MKRILWLFSILIIIIAITSCQNIPTLPNELPSDPEGVTEPTSWGNDVNFGLSLDKFINITPIGIPDTTKLKVSFINYTVPSDISEDNFLVFEDGKAQGFVLSELTETTNKIDVMVIMDTTGSMSQEIDGLKASLVNFINYLDESGFDIQVGILPYDDYAPANDLTLSKPWQDLTDDFTTAQSFVNELYAAGGGDGPENAYAGILYAWNNASWRPRAQRILILLTDAVSHYEGDGSSYELYSKSDVLEKIEGYATLYMVASTGYYYYETDTDFTSPFDPRELAVRTGGFVIYQSGGEEVDLSSIGIGEAIKSTFIIEFQSDSPSLTHEIDVYYEGPSGEQGHSELINVEY